MDESRRRGATRDDLLRLFGHHREPGVSAEEDDETIGEGRTDEELEAELDAELEDIEAELDALEDGMD